MHSNTFVPTSSSSEPLSSSCAAAATSAMLRPRHTSINHLFGKLGASHKPKGNHNQNESQGPCSDLMCLCFKIACRTWACPGTRAPGPRARTRHLDPELRDLDTELRHLDPELPGLGQSVDVPYENAEENFPSPGRPDSGMVFGFIDVQTWPGSRSTAGSALPGMGLSKLSRRTEAVQPRVLGPGCTRDRVVTKQESHVS